MKTALGITRGVLFLASGMAWTSGRLVSVLLAAAGLALLADELINEWSAR